MLAPALGRDVGLGAFDDLQQGLLHPFARHVAGDGGAVALAGDLVDFIDVDDALGRRLDVVVGILEQLDEDVFHVFAHVAGFGQGGCVGDGEGHLQHAGQGFRQQGLAAAGGADEQDVALFQLHLAAQGVGKEDPLVVVVHRHGQDLLGLVLADHVFVEFGLDLGGGQQLAVLHRLGDVLLRDDLVAQRNAFVADVDAGPGNEALHGVLPLAAEGTTQLAFRAALGIGHDVPTSLGSAWHPAAR